MSRKKPRDIEDLALWVPCEACGARPRTWCLVVRTGKWATYLHSDRLYVAQMAYSLGSQETDDQMRDWLKSMTVEQLLDYHQRLLEGKRW